MKKYLAFYGNVYHPKGGMDDFIGDYDNIEEAVKAIEESHKNNLPDDLKWIYAWCHIWNTYDKIEMYRK